MIFDPATLAVILATFLLAGAVKGVIGLGLPTVTLAILTVAIDLSSAMALLLIPSLVTNIWQGAVGGHARALLRQNWGFFLTATGTVLIGGLALARVDHGALSVLLGVLILAYAAVSLAGWRPRIPGRHRTWAGPLFGVCNGVLTGMTGSFVVPGVMYLNALGLPRDALVQGMGILFTLATVALAVSLGGQGFLSGDLGLISAIGLIPAMAGMMLGQRLRKRLPEATFRKVFFGALAALGLYIIAG